MTKKQQTKNVKGVTLNNKITMSTNETTRKRETELSTKKNDVGETSQKQTQEDKSKTAINFGAFILLALIFFASLLYFYVIYSQFPSLQDDEKEFIKLPQNINDAKQLGIVLKKYSNDHFYSVLVLFFSAYVL